MTRMAGHAQVMSLLEGVAEAALVRDLRWRHRMNFHLPQLIDDAKNELKEAGMPATPLNLRRAAEEVAARQETLLSEVVGNPEQVWDKAAGDWVEREIPDPRKYFIR